MARVNARAAAVTGAPARRDRPVRLDPQALPRLVGITVT
jgi:hypothetical protein